MILRFDWTVSYCRVFVRKFSNFEMEIVTVPHYCLVKIEGQTGYIFLILINHDLSYNYVRGYPYTRSRPQTCVINATI